MNSNSNQNGFPIVGIGNSAGGPQPLQQILQSMQKEPVVAINHLRSVPPENSWQIENAHLELTEVTNPILNLFR